MYGKKSKKVIKIIWTVIGIVTALSMAAVPLVYLIA